MIKKLKKDDTPKVGLDLGRDNAKLVILEETFDKSLQLKLGQIVKIFSLAALGREIKEILTKEQISAKDVYVGIRENLLRIKEIDTPLLTPEELNKIKEAQARKHLGYTKEEIVTDFLELEEEKDSKQKKIVILAAEKKNILDIIFSFKQQELKVSQINPAHTSLAAVIQKFYPQECIAAFELSQDSSFIVIVHAGDILYLREIDIGAAQIEAAGPNKVNLLSELNRSIYRSVLYYEQAGSHKVERVLLSGELTDRHVLISYLESALGIGVEVFNPFNKIKVQFKDKELKDKGPAFAVGVGLVI